jgi:hypothetical protein
VDLGVVGSNPISHPKSERGPARCAGPLFALNYSYEAYYLHFMVMYFLPDPS